jgi:hypothetical protein
MMSRRSDDMARAAGRAKSQPFDDVRKSAKQFVTMFDLFDFAETA